LTGEWRKLHNEELNDVYPSRNIVQVIKLKKRDGRGGARGVRGGRRGVYRVLTGKLEG
jgi:hypothetical protein